MKTESDKIRDQIGMTDGELIVFLRRNNLPFDVDGVGAPWPSYATLCHVLRLLS